MENNICNNEKIYACWLDCVYWLPSEAKYRLFKAAGKSTERIYKMPPDKITAVVGKSLGDRIIHHKNTLTPERVWDYIGKLGVKYTYCMEESFPAKLLDIPDAPFGIFYKGELPDANVPSVALIGARKCSEYGKEMARFLAENFAQNNINVISGMAYGIDGISQETALKSGGKSYAVLGCGVDIIYPKSNGQLYNDLVLNGGIISEYPPGLEPRPQLFPPRNRIISALSDAVIVVEAKEKSGTLITVDMALEQGKDVYAVPGRCTDKLSMGCNRLLRQGALIATSAQDVIDDMGWTDIADIGKPENNGKNDVTANLSPLAGAIYNVLEITPMSQDDIITKIRAVGIDCTVPKLCQAMVELELMECALRENGQYRIKNVLKNKK